MSLRTLLLSIAVLALSLSSANAQKRVLSYPFEFEKSFLARGDYDTYFLDDASNSNFSLVLKDNKKVEYVLLDPNFKTVSRISSDKDGTALGVKNIRDCTGGTISGHQYHFIYPEGTNAYIMETVDFDAKTVSHKQFMEVPKEEKHLIAFSDNNVFYSFTTNDKAKTLNISTVNAAGELTQKSIPFPIPEEASKRRNKLSEYLGGMKVMKAGEYPDLSNAVKSVKLFTQPAALTFVINDGDNPAHIVSLSLPDLSLQEKKIDYASLVPKEEKGKIYISSFLKGDQLFSLVLNKKSIRIVVNDVSSGAQLGEIEIKDDAALNMFADGPMTERRYGKRADAKDVTDVKKLISAFTRGTEGLMVTENKAGQLILTVGTYDLIPMSSGGGGGGYVGGWQQGSMALPPGTMNQGATRTAISVWNPTMYYRPGTPGYTTTDARYYNTTFFKLLLDPKSFKNVRGRVPMSVPDQIKDYMENVDAKAKATNQFAIGKNQYYGYYSKDEHFYVVEQIRIIQ